MNRNDKYIVMQPPYTLDKWKDGAAQVRTEKEFQELVNYIPYDGSIVTREGIFTLTHTPQGTTYTFPETGGYTDIPVTPPTIPPTYEICRCRMVLDFERGNDHIGWNSMIMNTDTNPVFTAMKCPNYIDNETGTTGQATCVAIYQPVKVGVGSLCLDTAPITNIYASSPAHSYGLFVRSSDTPPSWLYTGSGNSTTTLMWTYWMWPYYKNANADWHIGVRHSAVPPLGTTWGLMMRHFDDDVDVSFMLSNTDTYEITFPSGIVGVQQWYFIAGWIDIKNKNHGAYLYDDVTKVERYTARHTGMNNTHHLFGGPTTQSEVALGTSTRVNNALGGGDISDESDAMRGYLDFMTYWDLIPKECTSSVTLARLICALHATV